MCCKTNENFTVALNYESLPDIVPVHQVNGETFDWMWKP